MPPTTDTARALLCGSCDLHVHTAPSHFERGLDDFELAKAMDQYGMAGAVIKVHYGATAARALLVNRHAQTRSKVYGSVTLDWAVGGLNPYAVQSELLLGAKIVWLPTFHAGNHLEKTRGRGQPVEAPGIRLTGDDGRLLPAVHDILDLVAAHGAVLATGHGTPAEAFAVCSEATRRGIAAVLTHPDNRREDVPPEMQEALANMGVFIDRSWLSIVKGELSCARMAERIRRVSPARCVMSTDLGQAAIQSPPDGLLSFAQAMLDEGLSKSDVQLMMQDNPRALLRL